MANLGREVILWRVQFSLEAYRDQLGRAHDGYIVEEEIKIKIVEVHQVPNMWGGGTSEGWRAEDAQGKSYFCNWHSFPDDAMTPAYYWLTDDAEYHELVDAEQAVNGGIVYVKDEKKAIPEGFQHCEKHNIYFAPDDQCWRCQIIDKRKT